MSDLRTIFSPLPVWQTCLKNKVSSHNRPLAWEQEGRWDAAKAAWADAAAVVAEREWGEAEVEAWEVAAEWAWAVEVDDNSTLNQNL